MLPWPRARLPRDRGRAALTEGPGARAEARTDDALRSAIADLEARAKPLQGQLAQIRSEVEALRTELRRRERQAQLRQRQALRADVAAGHMPNLEEVVSGTVDIGGRGTLDGYRFIRQSATEVRLGYASANRQSLSLSDGSNTEDAADLASARALFDRGWEFGTAQAKGVRIYAAGTRAERMVPATEILVEVRDAI